MAYVLQTSLLSQSAPATCSNAAACRHASSTSRFLPFTDYLRQSTEHLARVERTSDAHHLDVCGSEMMVGYLLEITRR